MTKLRNKAPTPQAFGTHTQNKVFLNHENQNSGEKRY